MIRTTAACVLVLFVAGIPHPAESQSPTVRQSVEAPRPDSVGLTISRLQGEGDTAFVWNAVPLLPGRLRPGQLSWVGVTVDGAATAVSIAPTTALHSDGSLRSLVVRFPVRIRRGERIPAVLLIGGSEREHTPLPPTVYPTLPEAVALPTSPTYLIATDLVGPTVPVSASRALGGVWARYEDDFRRWADTHWTTHAADWQQNYYDRAQIYYAWWVRTGDLEYWKRATLTLVDYRTKYLEKNAYGSSHHWSQLEGVALHYLLTGDERSRVAVERTAQVLASYYRRGQLGNVRHPDMESRIQARSLLSALLAWEVQNSDPDDPRAEAWRRELPRILEQILSVQRPDGAFLWNGYCGASINYMNGMLNDVLIRYYTRFSRDSVIPSSVRRNADWMWATQWRRDGSFNYQSVHCDRPGDTGGPSPTPDLNGLFVSSYAWLYQETGDVRYRAAADEIFASAVRRSFLQGSKQFNQQYTSSYRYLAYRRGARRDQ